MLPTRITSRIRVTARCWQWLGSTNSNRYGTVSFDGKVRMAHRVVYEDRRGPIPAGLTLDHLCHNSDCVNPDHLDPVTHAENRRRSRIESCVRCGGPRVLYGKIYRCPLCYREQQRERMASLRA